LLGPLSSNVFNSTSSNNKICPLEQVCLVKSLTYLSGQLFYLLWQGLPIIATIGWRS
jgi:hypothetical protein